MPTVYSPPVSTYAPLATYTVPSGGDTAVTFSSIPATYRDLVLVIETSSASDTNQLLRINGDDGANYSYVVMSGSSSGDTSSSDTLTSALLTQSSQQRNFSVTQIMDYSTSDKHSTYLSRQNDGDAEFVHAYAGRWANTAIITSLEIRTSINTWSIGSKFSLYGIAS